MLRIRTGGSPVRTDRRVAIGAFRRHLGRFSRRAARAPRRARRGPESGPNANVSRSLRQIVACGVRATAAAPGSRASAVTERTRDDVNGGWQRRRIPARA
jgi:hypothetical protein